jgi:putative phosphoesterase
VNQTAKNQTTVVGVISDTHGSVAPAVCRALKGVDRILHAGDIIGGDVIPTLESIAPTVAVRGNMDGMSAASGLPWTQLVEIGGRMIFLLHDLYELDIDPLAAGVSVVVHGHTHHADIKWQGSVLYLNPGSAWLRGSRLDTTLARLTISDKGIVPEIIKLSRF